jgi:predicted regulator of Ras-like GTPase activity (Roadblock/LC7/MglB family)
VDDLKEVPNELSSEYEIDISAIVSRSGVPIAWNIPEDVHVETFATLSATLLGASEVVYTGLSRGTPKRVIVQSEDGTLVAIGLSKKALLVALGGRDDDGVFEAVENAARKIKDVLQSEANI